MKKPIILMTQAEFYKPGWIEKHWPLLCPHVELAFVPLADEAVLCDTLKRADLIYARGFSINADMIAAAVNLRGIVTSGVGVDKIDVMAASEHGIVVANSPGNTQTMAESTMLLVAAFAKNLLFWIDLGRAQQAPNSAMRGCELSGQTIGLIGFGRIGKSVARLANAYDMKCLAYDPYEEASDLAEFVPLDELLMESDFVSLHPLLTDETRKMIDAEALRSMKPTAYLINTSRGGVVDEEALIAALRSGEIAGAGLDVFEVEPPCQNNPLLSMKNVIATPHGLGQANESRRRCAELSQTSFISLIDGEMPIYTVNRDVEWQYAGRSF